jgi:hypothetical protein
MKPIVACVLVFSNRFAETGGDPREATENSEIRLALLNLRAGETTFITARQPEFSKALRSKPNQLDRFRL